MLPRPKTLPLPAARIIPRAPGAARSGALIGASVLDDPERYLGELARALGAVSAAIYLHDSGTLTSVAGAPDSPSLALRTAADTHTTVFDDEGAWIGAWCVRAGAPEAAGLLGLRLAPDRVRAGDPALVGELELLARRLAIELAWMRAHRAITSEAERLRATAAIDPLTGVWTRSALERRVEAELSMAQRRNEPVALAVFDIDGLRRVNDRYGHAAGDDVLAQVAAVIRANVRLSDEVARLGDDELALLLLGADVERARPVVEKVIRKIHETPLLSNDLRVRFTVRAGLTGFAPTERRGDEAFARAMQACEQAAGTPTRVAVVAPFEAAAPAAHLLDEDAQVGTPIGVTLGGSYRILHEISRGGSGVVYRGEDLGLGRPVAIKVLRHDLVGDQELIARFRREATILASLGHPNLVDVYAFGAGEEVYFVMELVEGPTVADVVEEALVRGDWLDLEAVVEVIAEIGDALEAMHGAGLVHCDVKPENVVLDREGGRAVLLDVGECKRHDEARRRRGTPPFSAPETVTGEEETSLIDIYSLGATAYLMLTGRLPYGSGDALAILSRQLDASAPPPSSIRRSLPAAVDAVFAKVLSRDPAARYGTPSSFAIALRTALLGTKQAIVRAGPRVGELRPITCEAPSIAPPRADPRAVVRGATFRVAAKVIAARTGEPWLRRIAEVRRDLGEALHPALPPMSWQPVELLDALIGALASEADRASILRSIGRGLVSVTFGHLYGADPASLSSNALLSSVPAFWERYFGFGSPIVVAAGDRMIRLRVDAFHAPAAELVAGFLERVTELTGVASVTVAPSVQGTSATFDVRWT